MSKRRRQSNSYTHNLSSLNGRDLKMIAKHSLSRQLPYDGLSKLLALQYPGSDLRRGPVRRYTPAKTVTGYNAPYKTVYKSKGKFKYGQLRFTRPRQTFICLRRRVRKEVLFATGGVGRANRNYPRKVHRNAFSSFGC